MDPRSVPGASAHSGRGRLRFGEFHSLLGSVSWIGRRVEVRETRDKIDIELDTRHIVTHDRALTPLHQRIMLPGHRPPRVDGVKRQDPHTGNKR